MTLKATSLGVSHEDVQIGLNILLIMTGHRPISARQVRVSVRSLHATSDVVLVFHSQIIDPGHINPETPKMPQKLVDKIPLVLYIPAPSPPVKATSTSPDDPDAEKDASVAIPVLSADHPNISPLPSALLRDTPAPSQVPHSYPPDASEKPLTPNAAPDAQLPQQPSPTGLPEATSLPRPNPRFAFFRRKKSKARSSPTGNTSPTGEGSETAVDGDSEEEWEDRYEKSSLPFVRLENNRATCAICLMDFDEPPRKSTKGKSASKVNTSEVGTGAGAAAGPSSEQSSTDPEPLRLLECGHVFHVRLRCV